MRKLVVVLMLTVSFALGMFSQNLIAGNWVFPKNRPLAPPLRQATVASHGWTIYKVPDGWKVLKASRSSKGNVSVRYQVLE